MLNVLSKGRRKSYDCFAIIEVRLKTVLFWATEVHTHMANVKEYPPPRVSAQPRAIEYLWQNFPAFFSAKISLRKFPSSPQTKIWLLWQFPFPLRYDDIYDDTSVKPCTCSEAINKLAVMILKYRGKRQVNTRGKGISHTGIKKLLMAYEILAW